ncbi:putative Tetratricopeptide repeat protein [Rubrivivax sp. A210]|uniref:SAM-dependent methyltransferase n=1 Tax=Rubrivivax sp. A210 TaxID=2772301 RepID=UPI0019195F70|nr:SAM-dependent methyltransferase [Rubrivivax sp. A210]CAD5373292.1 putative Tetratricopeptide repeat protein [Rubrivivax sp. A210]
MNGPAPLPTAAPDLAMRLAQAGGWRRLIQDFRPLCQSLEWRLGQQAWKTQGARTFSEGGVPYIVNNSGTLSACVARLLLDGLEEAPVTGPIRLLELGAGNGLFARYLLDELQRLCAEQGRSDYERLEFWVSDASPAMVDAWRQRGQFEPHAARVQLHACPAAAAAALQPGPWHAVFANYVLDVLPADVVRRGEAGWEQLHLRCWTQADAATLRQYTAQSVEALQALAETDDEAAHEALAPLLPVLESEAAFRPADGAQAARWHLDDGAAATERPFTVNWGALDCLDALLPRLAAGGFCLISDFVAEPGQGAQRFGPTTALGLNLEALERHVRGAGFDIAAAAGDGELPLRHRLITPGLSPRLAARFDHELGAPAWRWRDEPREQAQARAAAGHTAQALEQFRLALERVPGDWAVLHLAAEFATAQLRDFALARDLAQAALARNPWTDHRLWNTLGEAWLGLGQPAQALGCHLQALRLHARDAGTWLALARCRLALEQPGEALEAIARGLACDTQAMYRHLLLAEQPRALDLLARSFGAERAAQARRRAGC